MHSVRYVSLLRAVRHARLHATSRAFASLRAVALLGRLAMVLGLAASVGVSACFLLAARLNYPGARASPVCAEMRTDEVFSRQAEQCSIQNGAKRRGSLSR
eukprot:6179717-Pleurochrysis_carterae.AAC.2